MKINIKTLIFILVFYTKSGFANVSVNALFADHMVIQRDTKIQIWGWADANEMVAVETSWGAKAKVVTSLSGTWRVDVKSQKTGGPYQITIFSKNKIEVWNSSISNPVKVRYAWSSNPEGANLYNKEGLPAAVFTSEK